MIVSKAQFAEITGYSSRQVGKWVADGMPCEGKGRKGSALRIDTARGIAWLLAQADAKTGAPQTELTAARHSVEIERARKLKLENDCKMGLLVPAADVSIALNEAMRIIASNEDGIPGRLAQKLSSMTEPATIRQLLLTELRRGRQTAADRLREFGTEAH